MPTGLTGRSRSVTVTGVAEILSKKIWESQVVPELGGTTSWAAIASLISAFPGWWGEANDTGGAPLATRPGGPQVEITAAVGVSAIVDNHDGTFSITVTPSGTAFDTLYGSSSTASDPFVVTFASGNPQVGWNLSGSATGVEVSSLIEDQVSEGTWREHRYLTSFTLSWSLAGTVTVRLIGSGGSVLSTTTHAVSLSGTVTLHAADTPQGAGFDYMRGALAWDYEAEINCQQQTTADLSPVTLHDDAAMLATLFGDVSGDSVTASVTPSGGLTYSGGTAALSQSGASLAGMLAGLTYTIGTYHTTVSRVSSAQGDAQYTAEPHVSYAAVQVDRDYTGSGILPTLDLVSGGATIAGNTYTPPDSWSARLRVDNVPGSWVTAGAGTFPTTLNPGTFQYDEAWADTYGVLLDSSNFPDYPANLARFVISAPFDAGSIAFADNYQFACFRTLGEWAVASGAASLSAGSGSTLKVHVTAAARLSRSVLFRPYAHRYAKVRVQGPVGKSFSLVLATRTGSGATTYYRWAFTVASAGFQVYTLDLAQPQQSSPDLVTWFGVSALVHNYATLAPWMTGGGPYGRGMLLLADVGDWEWDYVEGYYRTDGSRTPLLILGPMEASGALAAAQDETQGQVTGSPPILYLAGIANGSKLWELAQPPGAVNAAWTAYVSLLNGDTGIVVTPAVGLALTEGALRSSIPTQPGYQAPGAGGTVSLQAEVTIAGWPTGYYGMGDPIGGSYGSALTFTALRGWNGERLGNLVSGGASLPGATVELRDDDSGTLIASSASDDDGLYRLPYRYGAVDVYSNTPRGGIPSARFQGSDDATYTALGKQLNAWWVRGDPASAAAALAPPVDASGYLLSAPTGPRRQFVVFDRYGWWQDLAVYPLGLWPALLEMPWINAYGRVTTERGGVVFRRALGVIPPFELTVNVTPEATGDAHACLAADERERLWITFGRSGDVYQVYSDDDGATWSDPVMTIAGGKFSRRRMSRLTGAQILAAVVDNQIHGFWWFPGDTGDAPASVTFKDSSGNPLLVEPSDAFDLEFAEDGQLRLVAGFHIQGESAVSDWWSEDDEGATWNRVS